MIRFHIYALVLAVAFVAAACNDQPASPDEPTVGADRELSKAPVSFFARLESASTSAQGMAVFTVDPTGQSINYRLIGSNIDEVTMAHIHLAPLGLNGPVAVWLYPSSPPAASPSGPIHGVFATGTITASSLVGPLDGEPLSVLIDRMINGLAYVNVHTVDYPAGEMRGQIQ